MGAFRRSMRLLQGHENSVPDCSGAQRAGEPEYSCGLVPGSPHSLAPACRPWRGEPLQGPACGRPPFPRTAGVAAWGSC
eukprot:2839016-Alexandrium_andersonii.AAC.1